MGASRRVRAYHLILTTYGFWLPNDPRGSWSDFVRAWELRRFGPATRTTERRSLAWAPHDRELRLAAKQALVRPPVHFDGLQARAVARGFARYVEQSGCLVSACSIMPQHVHMVVARHHYSIEQVANLLKGAATRQLLAEGLHPFSSSPYRDGTLPTPWTRRKWDCYLGTDDEIVRAVRYVDRNPGKEGKRKQDWSFVEPFRPGIFEYI